MFNSVEITFLGHSGILIQTDNIVIAIDPWVIDNPLTPKDFKNPSKIDLIVLTHGHFDHAADALSLGKSLNSQLVATHELANILASEGYPKDKISSMNKGGSSVFFNNIKISLTHAIHSSSYNGSNGVVYAGEPCGVVFCNGEKTIFHAGDTDLFSDLALIGKRYTPDIACLPIGDCFTMGPVEAAQAAELLGVKQAIPIHHTTFPLLTGTPGEFETACKELNIKAIILNPGGKYQL
jgi:L-ascorbate metabolism protein UlaG (beta-lactamase superfamily)